MLLKILSIFKKVKPALPHVISILEIITGKDINNDGKIGR